MLTTALHSGRTLHALLEAACDRVRALTSQSESAPALESRTYECSTGVGLLAVHLRTNRIRHANKGFGNLASWAHKKGLDGYFLRTLLHPEDALRFHDFAAGPYPPPPRT